MGRIAVIGSANADLVVDIDHRPVGGETIIGSDLVTTPGGKGANQAVAAALVGGEVSFVGCVGKDSAGAMLRASLAEAGAGIDGLAETDAPTGWAVIMVTPNGENSIIVAPGANRRVTPEFLQEQLPRWGHADVVVMQLEVPLDTVEWAAAQCRDRGIRFVLNAAPAARLSPAVLGACDPLVVNETEAAFLLEDATAGSDVEELARRLLALGPASVVVTLGSAGSVALARGSEVVVQAAHRVQAIDTTGAGDAFVGSMATALANGDDFAQALALGTAVAAYAVQHRGAQASYPTLSEVSRP